METKPDAATQDEIRLEKRALLKVERSRQADLMALLRPDPLRFSLWTASHVAVWIAAAALILLTDNVFVHVLAVLVLGNQLHAMTVLQHDCGHQNAFKSAKANLWTGRFLAWFIIFPFSSFTECHKHHHRYLGDPDKDPDDWNYAAGVRWMFVRIATFAVRFTHFSLVRYGKDVRNKVLRELIFNLGSMAGLLALFAANGRLYEFALIFVVPLLILTMVINPISRGYEHFPMATMPVEDEERLDLSKNTITVTSRVVGLLWANINYHVEHHIYPGVPFFNLPKVHQLLADRPFQRDGWLLARLLRRPAATSPAPASPAADAG